MPLPKKSAWFFSAYLCFFVAVFASGITWLVHWHWLNVLWFHYAWPSDVGNGPEAIQQTILYFIIAAICIPIVRQFVKREFSILHEKIESHEDHFAAIQANLHLALRGVEHVIHHSENIPDLEELTSVILPTGSPEVRSDSEELTR